MDTIRFDWLRELLAGMKARPRYLTNLNAVIGAREREDHDTDPDLCSTLACAMGTAALMPSFNARGLRFAWNDKLLIWGLTLHGDLIDYADAGEQLFGLTMEEADDLFGTLGTSSYDLEDDSPWSSYDRAPRDDDSSYARSIDHVQAFEYRLRRLFEDHGELLHARPAWDDTRHA